MEAASIVVLALVSISGIASLVAIAAALRVVRKSGMDFREFLSIIKESLGMRP
jgi:hypothetical protein